METIIFKQWRAARRIPHFTYVEGIDVSLRIVVHPTAPISAKRPCNAARTPATNVDRSPHEYIGRYRPVGIAG